MTTKEITFTRIKHDSNGNPRYVCHYINLLTDDELSDTNAKNCYAIACKRANSIGGRKFHNKQYGGGIVFSTYNIDDLAKHIARVTGGTITSITMD